jgi:hypothetical protein
MGTFEAFVIQLPSGRVVSKYGQMEAKRSFSSLIGSELERPKTSASKSLNQDGVYTKSRTLPWHEGRRLLSTKPEDSGIDNCAMPRQ